LDWNEDDYCGWISDEDFSLSKSELICTDALVLDDELSLSLRITARIRPSLFANHLVSPREEVVFSSEAETAHSHVNQHHNKIMITRLYAL
jgi:hypothetical protein